jgi:hypothetical protein
VAALFLWLLRLLQPHSQTPAGEYPTVEGMSVGEGYVPIDIVEENIDVRALGDAVFDLRIRGRGQHDHFAFQRAEAAVDQQVLG